MASVNQGLAVWLFCRRLSGNLLGLHLNHGVVCSSTLLWCGANRRVRRPWTGVLSDCASFLEQISHPPRMVLQSRAPEVNVWQQIGAQEPHAAANLVMKQNDDTGYKARKVQLAERAAPSVWQQIGAQEPHAAANLVMKQNDDTGY